MKKNVTVPKKKLLGALLMAKKAGMEQGAAQAGPPMGTPTPPPAPMGGAPGMKKGGFVPFGKKDADGEKKMPPWMAKKGTEKMACGGLAGGGSVGGRGDGCAQRGKTRGRQV